MHAIFVTRFAPQPVGHGGHHRSYQIFHDLQNALGPGAVRRYTPVDAGAPPAAARSDASAAAPQHRIVAAGRQRLALFQQFLRVGGHPYKLLAYLLRSTFSARRRFGRVAAAPYRAFVAGCPRPIVCVLDHPYYADLTSVNQSLGVPTINCNHNLETFDLGELDLAEEWGQYAFIADFVSELKWLAACDARLLISKVEAGVVGGLGWPTQYYPYYPVGDIRARQLAIRQQREHTPPEPGLYVMVGSAAHTSTRESFAWFVAQARQQGLPAGVRVVIGGLQTDTLLPAGESVPGLELRGWLTQPELDALLTRCSAFIAPQARGFGALTRLPELACAGIPTFVSEHASYAIDLPPGAVALGPDWTDWRAALEQPTAPTTAADYAAWEARQPSPLGAVVRQLAASRA